MSLNKKNRILTTIDAIEITANLKFPANFQFQIIEGVVYTNGVMIEPHLQNLFITWINKNPTKFLQTQNF